MRETQTVRELGRTGLKGASLVPTVQLLRRAPVKGGGMDGGPTRSKVAFQRGWRVHGDAPTHWGDLVIESQGMAPIAEDQRYGSSWRNFTVWFAPNMELSGVFTGTLAFTLGLGFGPASWRS